MGPGDIGARFSDIVLRTKFPGYETELFNLSAEKRSLGRPIWAIRVIYTEPDVMTGVDEKQQGRWWVLEDDYNETQVVQTVFKAILTSMEHRLRENFTYKKKAVLQPHFSMDELLKVAPTPHPNAKPVQFDEQEEPMDLYDRIQTARTNLANRFTDEHPLIHIGRALDIIDGALAHYNPERTVTIPREHYEALKQDAFSAANISRAESTGFILRPDMGVKEAAGLLLITSQSYRLQGRDPEKYSLAEAIWERFPGLKGMTESELEMIKNRE